VTLAELLAGVVVAALNAYVLFGGADFGGGVWDLLARGPRRDDQRDLVAHAIGPVWEANHVWLILAVVLLFSCFPPAFARLAIALRPRCTPKPLESDDTKFTRSTLNSDPRPRATRATRATRAPGKETGSRSAP
jgi:hypothetical protein